MSSCFGFFSTYSGISTDPWDAWPSKWSCISTQLSLAKTISGTTSTTETTPGTLLTDRNAQIANETQILEEKMQRKTDLSLEKLRREYERGRKQQSKAKLVFNTAQTGEGHTHQLFANVSKVRPVEAGSDQKTSDKGTLWTDRNAQIDNETRILEEKMQRKTDLSLENLRREYEHGRRLQSKAKLVFNTAQTGEGHTHQLFGNVSKALPTQTRHHDNYPAIKAPSKAARTFKKKRDASVSEVGSPEKLSLAEKAQTEQLVPVIAEPPSPDYSREPHPKQVVGICQEGQMYVGGTPSKAVTTSGSAKLADDPQTSVLYQVDKKAIYPKNFQPFPRRNLQPKRKYLHGKT